LKVLYSRKLPKVSLTQTWLKSNFAVLSSGVTWVRFPSTAASSAI